MTDRVRHLTVVLDRDYRTDDLEEIISAIKHIRPVASVKAHVVEGGDYVNREVVKTEILPKMYKAIEEAFYPDRKKRKEE